MAVKINDMDMPRSCSDCVFYDEEEFDGTPWCIVNGRTHIGVNYDCRFNRMNTCPLEEIQDGEDGNS